MNAKGIILTLTFLIITAWNFPAMGQQASAEFISKSDPAQLQSGEQIKEGIQNLFYNNQRLYLVNIWSGLQVLDVTDVKNPKELGYFTPEHRAYNVYVDEHFAYLSQKRGGVLLLDVSNPSNIKTVGKIKTKGDAYYVLAAYPYVYVAEETQCVGIYDVSDVSNPVEVGRFKGEGWAWSLFLDGNILYVGAKNGGMGILDVSNPSNPEKRGKFDDVKFTKSIFVDDNIAYVAEGPKGLVLVDVSDLRKPKLISKVEIDGWVGNVSKSGSSVFLSNDKGKRLDIIDVTDPQNPKMGGAYESEYKIYAAVKSAIYVYVAADQKSLVLRYNHPPTIEPISDQIVDESQLLIVQPIASDLDNDDIYFDIQNLPPNASFDSLSGALTWTPDFEQSAEYRNITITVRERTESALYASATFNISVQHVNRLPELPEVLASTVDENAALTFTIDQGSDPDKEDAGKLVYSVSGLPEGATFDGLTRTFSWTPSYEQSGAYPLTFTLSDPAGGAVSQETVVTVAHIDRKPDLAELKPLMVDENADLKFTLQGSDPDAEDQTSLSYYAANLPEGATFDATTATFSWTPTYDQSGIYEKLQFVFTAGALSDTIYADATVNHVNRGPLLDAVVEQVIDENQLLSFMVSGSDMDTEDAGKLVLSAENLPQGAVFNADSGLFSFTPSFEQSGTFENVTFKITDPSGLVDSKSIAINVQHVNRTPALAAIEPKLVDENTVLSFEMMGSDPDVEDAGKLIYSIDPLPRGAVLDGSKLSWTPEYEQSGTYPVQFTVSDGHINAMQEALITVSHVNRSPVLDALAAQATPENELLTFTLSGSDPDSEDSGKIQYTVTNLPQGAQFDSASVQFSWMPTFEQSGSYTVPFTVSDPSGLTDTKDVTITVNHVNRTPVFNVQAAQVVDENQTLAYTLVPATDPDVEDAEKIVYVVSDLPQGAIFDDQNLNVTWTPGFDQSGVYTSVITVSDGAFSVNQPLEITVNHVNRAPQITQAEAQSVDENSPWTYTTVFSDPDTEDKGQLSLVAENLPQGANFDAASGTFSWTPDYEQSGLYEGISVSVTDPAGLSDQKAFNLTVNHVNRAPQLEAVAAVTVSENEAVQFELVANDEDQEDEGKLIFSAVNLPEGATLDAASGAFNWIPTFVQAGNLTITCKVGDSGNLFAEQSATLTVIDVNHSPQLTVPVSQTIKENDNAQFTVSATDEDTDNTLVLSAENLPEGANFDANNGTFDWTPDFNQTGSYTVTFKVSDGVEEASSMLEIQVENVNRAPEINGPGNTSVIAGETVNISFSGSDPDGDELSFDSAGLPSDASFNSGSLNWTPAEDQLGSFSMTISVSDGTDKAEMKTSILVLPKPAPAPPDTTVQ